MNRLVSLIALLSLVLLSGNVFGQSANATVSGTASDSSRALIPGVTITATNTQTGVVTTVLSNEAGAYNFASLQPGTYRVSAELPGFRTQSYTDVELGTSQQVRLNFTLEVGTVAQNVEVTVAADTLLATSSASVGSVLPQRTVHELPTVGRDALNLVNILGGVQQATGGVGGEGQYAAARTSATFAGLYATAGMVNTTRDGVSVQENRYQLGMVSNTRINPDLVGELRVVVAPVDAESGGGVGQVQVLTRSGTNQFRGSAVWNVQNSALNPNTWDQNRLGIRRDWFNRQEATVSYGGPIVKNKTFFFALFDAQRMKSRSEVTTPVLTATARQGIFRFFPGVVNGNAESIVTFGANPTAPVVDLAGNPVRPAAATGDLQSVSVFGYDPLRPGFDRSGFIQRFINDMPLPNDFRGGDGLNMAVHRWTRPGDSLVGGQLGTEDDTNRNQWNIKVDHNFNGRNKFTISYTRENLWNKTRMSDWPGGWDGKLKRWPRLLTSSFVSTLSPSLLNEARFGWRLMRFDSKRACDANEKEVNAWLPNVNGYTLLVYPTSFTDHKITGGCAPQPSDSPVYTYADSLSWSKGKHAFKGGAELHHSRSDAPTATNWLPVANGGAGNFPVTNIETARIPGLIGGNLTAMRNLLLTLSGSLSNVQQAFRLASPTAKQFSDIKELNSYLPPSSSISQREFSVFFKDDWKVRSSLTLNLGVRFDYHGVPYETYGNMATLQGGGLAGFGYSGRSFDDYWKVGPQRGDLNTVQFVGKNSPNPKLSLWNNDLNNFGPAIGFSWSVPWFGVDKTTLRGGYGVTYIGTVGRASNVDAATGPSMPGVSHNATYTSTQYLDLTNPVLPVPRNMPLQPISVTDRTQSVTVFDNNTVSPYIQTFNMSLSRSLHTNLNLDVRYVGTKGSKLYGSIPLNQRNYLTNGLLEALNITRAGGDAPLFDQMLRGLVFNAGQAAVGTGGFTGSAALRQNTTFRTAIANGDYGAVANTLNQSTMITGQTGGLLRNGGLPENFIANNPQFNNVTLTTNPGSSIYHSLEVQATLRPTAGFSYQASYTWSKAITDCENSGCSTWIHPLQRRLSRSLQGSDRTHGFRSSGIFELPFGPRRTLLKNSSGVVARLVENWQLSWIFTANSGAPLAIGTGNTYVGSARPDIIGSFQKDQAKAHMTDGLPQYFAANSYQIISDPQCDAVTALQATRTACTLRALADSQGHIVLQHSQPGTLGTLGTNWLRGPGRFNFDLSASKTVRISETKSFQLRVDAHNVLNKPLLGNPNLNLNAADFGQIPASQVFGARQFQGLLRLNF